MKYLARTAVLTAVATGALGQLCLGHPRCLTQQPQSLTEGLITRLRAP